MEKYDEMIAEVIDNLLREKATTAVKAAARRVAEAERDLARLQPDSDEWVELRTCLLVFEIALDHSYTNLRGTAAKLNCAHERA